MELLSWSPLNSAGQIERYPRVELGQPFILHVRRLSCPHPNPVDNEEPAPVEGRVKNGERTECLHL